MAVLAQWSGKTILQPPCPWVCSDRSLPPRKRSHSMRALLREKHKLSATHVPPPPTGWSHDWLLHGNGLYGQLRVKVILQMNNFYSQMILHPGLRSCLHLFRNESLRASSLGLTPGSSDTSLHASWVSPFPKWNRELQAFSWRQTRKLPKEPSNLQMSKTSSAWITFK